MRLSSILFVMTCLASLPAMAGRCDTVLSDGICDCGCLVADPDCASVEFSACVRGHCPAGQVPWEHANAQCMTSACGDGWKDEAAGEACDDGNALASGGCSADCHAVTAGYDCGPAASGCHLAPPDAGVPGPDAGAVDAGTVDAGQGAPGTDAGATADAGTQVDPKPMGGCAATPQSGLLAGLALLVVAMKKRQ